MGYFGAGVGRRVNAGHESAPTAPAPKSLSPKPLFAAALGVRPQAEKPSSASRTAAESDAPDCPLCRGATEAVDGLIVCIGRCRARWLKDASGQLIDVAALPFGVCACCEPRRALAGAEWGALCPDSGKGYLLLPGGPAPVEIAAPDGLCACCAPPAPLAWEDRCLVCSRKRDQVYSPKGGDGTGVNEADVNEAGVNKAGKPDTGKQSQFVQAVDAALHANSAQLTVFGLFDVT